MGEVTASIRAERSLDRFVVHAPGGARSVPDAAAALEVLLEVLNRLVLAQCRDFAVHAGAVARDGRVVALPAVSGGGKTTLTAALLRDGWEYVSDEALVIDAAGRVRPYPKWLSMHTWTLDRLALSSPPRGRDERAVPVQELQAVVAGGELRVALVVLTQRRVGPPETVSLDRAQAAAELLRCSFNHYEDPVARVALTATVLRDAAAVRLALDDPVRAAAHLSDVLA